MKHFIFCLFYGLTVSTALAAPAHVHGEARLEISMDDHQLLITLESPLDSLLGFEHPPRNATERQAVARMAAKLKQAGRLFVPSVAARCALTGVELLSPVLAERPAPGSHHDLNAQYTWRCARPEALREVTIGLLADFPRLRRLTVEFVGPRGQRAGRIDAQNPRFSW